MLPGRRPAVLDLVGASPATSPCFGSASPIEFFDPHGCARPGSAPASGPPAVDDFAAVVKAQRLLNQPPGFLAALHLTHAYRELAPEERTALDAYLSGGAEIGPRARRRLMTLIARHADGPGAALRSSVLRAFLVDHHTTPAQFRKIVEPPDNVIPRVHTVPGARTTERFEKTTYEAVNFDVDLGGHRIRFVVATSEFRTRRDKIDRIIDGLASLPPMLRAGLDSIQIPPSTLPGWETTYMAAGGDGSMSVHPAALDATDAGVIYSTLLHECAHLVHFAFANRVLDAARPQLGSLDQALKRACRSERLQNVTDYAREQRWEQFAETTYAVLATRALPATQSEVRGLVPQKAAVVDGALAMVDLEEPRLALLYRMLQTFGDLPASSATDRQIGRCEALARHMPGATAAWLTGVLSYPAGGPEAHGVVEQLLAGANRATMLGELLGLERRWRTAGRGAAADRAAQAAGALRKGTVEMPAG